MHDFPISIENFVSLLMFLANKNIEILSNYHAASRTRFLRDIKNNDEIIMKSS